MKVVAHIIKSLNRGGCENYLLNTLPLINNDQQKHLVVTLYTYGSLTDKLEKKGIMIINIGFKNIFHLKSWIKLVRILNQLKANSIITYLSHADLFIRAIRIFLPPHTLICFIRSNLLSTKLKHLALIDGFTSKLVDYYFFNSETAQKSYSNKFKFPLNKSFYIPNGIIIPKIPKKLKHRSMLQICSVGSLYPNKGHKYLLEALNSLKTPKNKFKVLIIGDGPELKSLLIQTKQYDLEDNVKFLGEIDDVEKILSNSDIFVLPTLFEGRSNAVLEAMAAGLPVIITDIPENRELISNGINGILVQPRDSQAITDALDRLINNPTLARKIGNAARLHIIKLYDINKTSQQFQKSIQNIISKHN